ncbi:hypothetical protein [Pantoea sp. BAV 3049]|uniref:phage baseplate plug family protein n=1 Tax=Pantoea sp. BAV 3049 TaxID=2654188 RepID=UPI00131CA7B8|nr:hypothetical protein [Pantoea sp. BAV 3049]
MQYREIPLSADNQQFSIAINGTTYTIRALWRDDAGWVIDLLDSGGTAIINGIPLVTGADLLSQYKYLGLGFVLMVICDVAGQSYPTKTDLGTYSHLYVITELS